MSVDDSRMPLSEDKKVPQVYKLDIKEPTYKIDKTEMKICETSQLIGLTKEELEYYRNDPFWKVVRCTMFILFWAAWIVMFFGAIALIAFSPKCVVRREPEWWRKQVSYQIFTPSFRDSNNDGIGDFNGIREKLNDLRKIGIKTIWVTPVTTIQKDDFVPLDVIDFTTVDERFGTADDLKLLVDEAHNLEMYFTMDLPISTTSTSHKWFKSAKAGHEYVDYYIWKKASDVRYDPSYVAEEGKESAYLAYKGKDPILNWRNPAVRDSIFEVAKRFLDMGVDGFHMNRISQLVKHLPTSEGNAALEMLNDFIGSLREYANRNKTLESREIAVSASLDDLTGLPSPDTSAYGLPNLTFVIDNSVTKMSNDTCQSGISKCLQATVLASLERSTVTRLPHAWQFMDYHVSRLTTRFDKATATLLTFVQLSLPGIIELYYGQELSLEDSTDPANRFTGLMQWDSSEYSGFTAGSQKPFFSTTSNYKADNFEVQFNVAQSPLKTAKVLARMRQRDNDFVLGEIYFAPLLQDVILFSRFQQTDNVTDGAIYVVASNFATSSAEVDGATALPADCKASGAEIVITTPNINNYSYRSKISLFDQKIILGPKSGIIIKAKC
uniref:alpha-glucosidase n=1 Tax=Setaria digitata TaxID=48799 RepID=A0A915PNX5_9BILA